MDAHIVDSRIFGDNWSTPESRELFAERARIVRWVEIVKALARAQADLGVIPTRAADAIDGLDGEQVDLERVAERTRTTSHSTLGLIEVLQDLLPESAREHVYYGATVQDVSDTAMSLEIVALARVAWRDLWRIEGRLLDLAEAHRDTPMLGRTHGQPGAPISVGLKVATWADEVSRSLDRIRGGRARWGVGQLAGAVGALGFYGDEGQAVRRRFCELLELESPSISWTATRDRTAEFASVAAIASSTLARIANEIYNLQRAEIGEVSEGSSPESVGSITMPHKRNPERSEQVVALARVARSSAQLLLETMVGEHERDGSTWKVEWAAVPQLGHSLLAAASMSDALIAGLELHVGRMEENLSVHSLHDSQELLRRLAGRVGKHRAQSELNEVYRQARVTGAPVLDLLRSVVTEAELDGLTSPSLGSAPAMVDAVVADARERRRTETETWE